MSYAALNLYRILEFRYPNGGQTRTRIDREFPSIQQEGGNEAYARRFLSGIGEKTPGRFIYYSYRIAVAHASSRYPSDPDEAAELQSLHVAADILRLLARRFILNELGLSDSRYNE